MYFYCSIFVEPITAEIFTGLKTIYHLRCVAHLYTSIFVC